MLNNLLPDDRRMKTHKNKRALRNQMKWVSEGEDATSFNMEELIAGGTQGTKGQKDPGYLGIKREVVKRIFGRYQQQHKRERTEVSSSSEGYDLACPVGLL